jgi:ribosomal protein S18 acetylase RimI-like enzyme
MELRQIEHALFLKKLYPYRTSAAAHRLTGHTVATGGAERNGEVDGAVRAENTPVFRFYRRHGFDVVKETSTKFVLRRAMAEAN